MVHANALLITLIVVLLALTAAAFAQAPGAPVSTPTAPAPRGAEPAKAVEVGPVNINTAGVTELMTLGGVGRTVAEKIVQYRETHGPFKKPEEVRRVQGIGAGLWERNRDRIVVK